MIDILAWIAIVVGVAGVVTRVISLYAPRRSRERPSPDKFRAEWYWIGMSFIVVFSMLSIIANKNRPLEWAAISAACAIACANATVWTVRRNRGRRHS